MSDDLARKGSRYTIRPMLIEDYDAVRALWDRTEGVGLDASDEREPIARYLQRNSGLSLVAQAEDVIIGAVLCGHDGRRGYLSHLAVDVAWRSRGIGRALIEVSLAALNELGLLRCNLRVFTRNEAGIAFWRHIGWRDRDDLQVMTTETVSLTAKSPARPL